MNKYTRFLFALWLVFSCSMGSPTPCSADARVTLKQNVEIKRFAVKLSDLFDGIPPEIDRDIAQAPAPCKPAVYDVDVLSRLATKYRLDWDSQSGVDHTVVTSSCARITDDMIRDAVIAKIKKDTNSKDRSFEVAFDTHTVEVDLPMDEKPAFDLTNFFYDQASRHFHGDLSTQTAHGPYTAPITGTVAVKHSIPVLAHNMEASTTISAADLDWVQIPEERLSADVITDASQLIGHELHHDKAENEVLRTHDVMPQRLVLRGTLVVMQIATPMMTVTAQGKAQQDGAIGDTVRIINTQSNRMVEGVVTGPGTVEIRVAQKQLASVE